jgi:hypothetical protein
MLSGGIKKLKALPPSAAFAKTQLKFQRIQICANPRLKQMLFIIPTIVSHLEIASKLFQAQLDITQCKPHSAEFLQRI